MAKKSNSKKSKTKAKPPKRDNDLFTQLREQGVRKSVADQIARASAGLDSGKKKAEQGVRDAAENFRKLAADLESKLPVDTDIVGAKAEAAKADVKAKGASARMTAKATAKTAKREVRRTKTAAKRTAGSAKTTAETARSGAKATTGTARAAAKKPTAASRSAAAKKAAATRKANAAKRTAAAKQSEGT